VDQGRLDFSSSPPTGLERPEILLCVPVRYPGIGREGDVVGVFTLASDCSASNLLKLYESNNRNGHQSEDNQAVAELMKSLHEDVFLGAILPAIGLGDFIDTPPTSWENFIHVD
jgi:hypothetical protein